MRTNHSRLNQRLILQAGYFYVLETYLWGSSKISKRWTWDLDLNIVKLVLRLQKKTQVEQFASQLKQMNMTSALLFPGLDGFAFSLGELSFAVKNLLVTGLEPPGRQSHGGRSNAATDAASGDRRRQRAGTRRLCALNG
jgi:hypothetical protein